MSKTVILILLLLLVRADPSVARPLITINTFRSSAWSGSRIEAQVGLGGFVEDEEVVMQWRAIVGGATVDKGEERLNVVFGQAETTIAFNMPKIKHRATTSIVVVAVRDEQVLARAETSITVFQKITKEEFTAGLVGFHPLVYDPDNTVAGLLDDLEIPFARRRWWEEIEPPEGIVFLLGPGALERKGFPPKEIINLARNGATIVVFRQDDFCSREEWKKEGIELLPLRSDVKAGTWGVKPPLWSSDIDDKLLDRWAGGRVGTALFERPASGNVRTWLMDGDGEIPLIMEVFPGKGRIVFCQCPVIEQFNEEPVAELLMKNLLRYASAGRTEKFKDAFELRRSDGSNCFAGKSIGLFPREIEASVLFRPDDLSGEASLFLIGVDTDRLKSWRRQHLAREEIRRRVFDAGATLLVCGVGEGDVAFLEKLTGRTIELRENAEGAVRLNGKAEGQLLWGLTPGPVMSAIKKLHIQGVFAAEGDEAVLEIIRPGLLVKFTVGRGRVIVCQVPLDGQSKGQRRFHAQLMTNMGIRLLEPEEK